MIRYIVYIFVFAIIFAGCECIPGIDTPKDIHPENGAKIAIFHFASSYNSISVSQKGYTIADNLGFASHTPIYKDAFTGYSNLKITESSSKHTIYNGIYTFEQGKHYSLYYFECNRAKIQQVQDSIYKGASFVRILNMYPNESYYTVNLTGKITNIRLHCGDMTELYEIGKDEVLTISDADSNPLHNTEVRYLPDQIQNIVILNEQNLGLTVENYSIAF